MRAIAGTTTGIDLISRGPRGTPFRVQATVPQLPWYVLPKAVMAGATSLPVLSINAPPLLPGVDFSDHLNYWNEGFAAFMVTDTAFMRNPHYHQAEDSFEKLDYGRMAKVVLAVYAVTQSQ